MDIQKLRLIIDSSAAADGATDWKNSTDKVAAGATTATASITKMETAIDAATRQARQTTAALSDHRETVRHLGQDYERLSMQDLADATAKFDKMTAAVGDNRTAVLAHSQALQMDESMTRKMTLAHIEALAMNEKLGQTFNTSGAGLGRLRMGVTSLASQLTGTNPIIDRTVATLGSMTAGTTAMLGVLGGVVVAGVLWKAYSEGASKAAAEQDKMTKSLEQWYAKEREGAAGDFPKQIEAEKDKIADLKKELDSFGKLGAVGEGGSKGLAWARVWADAVGTLASAGAGQVEAMKGFWKKLNDEIHDGAAHATNEITTGFAAIHAATVKAHDLIQRQQADALAQLITSDHATAAERAKAREILKADIAELAKLDRAAQNPGGGSAVDRSQRLALSEEIKALQEALNPAKLVAAEDHLAAVKDALARMQAEAKSFGSDASINTRTQAIIDDLDRLEKKYPKLTDEIERMKSAAVDAGDALKGQADDKVRKQIDDAYNAQRALDDAMRDSGGTLRELTATKAADLEISRLQLQLGHELTNDEKDKIHYTHENAAALAEEGEAAKKSAEAQKQALQKVVDQQKQSANEMQRQLSHFYVDAFNNGLRSFGDLFDSIRDMFVKMLAEMAAKATMAKLGPSMMGAFGIGTGGNSANPHLWEAGLGNALASGTVGYGIGQAAPSATMGALGGAAAGALTGAALGSVVPVLGTAAGAVVGAVAGLVGGLLGHAAKVREEAKAMQAARADFFRSLDDFAYGLGEHSQLDQGLHSLSNSMADLQRRAGDLHLTNKDLAEAEIAATEAAARLKKEFLDSIDQQINAASGKDYINSALNFQKAFQQNLTDIATAGGDTNKATELFVKQMEQLGTSLDEGGLKDLLAQLPALTAGMDPAAVKALSDALGVDLAKAIADLQKQALITADQLVRANESLASRFAVASGDPNADAIALTATQRQETFDAQQAGATPEYLAQLRLVQLYEEASATVRRQTDALIKTTQDQLQVQTDALGVAKDTLNATKDVVTSLAKYRQSLSVGSLSPLSPQSQIDEARRQLEDAFTKAMAGDKTAAMNVTNLSDTFLQLLRDNQASGPGYVDGFQSVTDMLDRLTQQYGDQLTQDQSAVDAAQAQVDLLTQTLATLQDATQLQERIRAEVTTLLQQQEDAAQTAADSQLSELGAMQATNAEQLATNKAALDAATQLYQQTLINGNADVAAAQSNLDKADQMYQIAVSTHSDDVDSAAAARDAAQAAYQQAVDKAKADGDSAFHNLQALMDVRDKLETQQTQLADQVKAVEASRDAAKKSADDMIAAILSGKDFKTLGDDMLKDALDAQTLANNLNNLASIQALRDQTNRLIDAINGIGDGTTPGATDPHGWAHTHRTFGGGNVTSTTNITSTNVAGATIVHGGDSGELLAELRAVTSVLRGIRSDAQESTTAVDSRLQGLQLEFSELVQQGRLADRGA